VEKDVSAMFECNVAADVAEYCKGAEAESNVILPQCHVSAILSII